MPAPVPNHHADHPGFAGPSGLFAAGAFLFARTATARLAIELSGLQAGERVVDVGCGPGVAVNQARLVGAKAIGVDPSPVMLRVARRRWRSDPRVEWRCGTAESLPVDDHSAQVVWSLSTVHHWADVDTALVEVRRVLAPGGRLVVTERRITDTRARGAASHGWIPEQAESFAERCRRLGFEHVVVNPHQAPANVLSVVARARAT